MTLIEAGTLFAGKDDEAAKALRAKLNAADLGEFAAKFSTSEGVIDDLFAALARIGGNIATDANPAAAKSRR